MNNLSVERQVPNADYEALRPETASILQDLLDAPDFAVFYLWGARGMGKTHTAQELCDAMRRRQYRVVKTDGRTIRQPDDLFRMVGNGFQMTSEDTPLLNQVLRWLDSLCSQARMFWVIDDLDPQWSSTDWFRTAVLEVARRQVPILLVGSEPPARMWSGQQYFQTQIRTIGIMPLSMSYAQTLLQQRRDIDETAVAIALDICQGVPEMLVAIADGLSVVTTMSPPSTLVTGQRELEWVPFMIEQLCHPGSKRLKWRAGQGEGGLDLLVAAASLVPSFNQELITRMVGREVVRTFWNRFTQIAFVTGYRGGYYAITPPLRHYINRTVQETRPWMWEQWANVVTEFVLRQFRIGRLDSHEAWSLVGGFVRNRVATTPFLANPPHNGTTFRWDPEEPEGTAGIYEGQHIVAEAQYVVDKQEILQIYMPTPSNPSERASTQLIHELAASFSAFREIRWRVDPDSPLGDALTLLRFVPVGSGEWRLQMPEGHYESWLTEVLSPPHGVKPIDPIKAIQRLLQAIRDGEDDPDPAVQQFWISVGGSTSFQTWFLDALNSVQGRALCETTLLTLYYVDRQGTHEDLTQMLHVSRATYFRNLRSAHEALATAVFV